MITITDLCNHLYAISILIHRYRIPILNTQLSFHFHEGFKYPLHGLYFKTTYLLYMSMYTFDNHLKKKKSDANNLTAAQTLILVASYARVGVGCKHLIHYPTVLYIFSTTFTFICHLLAVLGYFHLIHIL